jgi:hypothetical protein
LDIGNSANNLNFTQIKTAADTSNTTIQSQADFLTHLYVTERFEFVGKTPITPVGSSDVSFSPLLPNTNYTLCAYFQNADLTATSSGPTCNTFTTPNTAWPLYRALLTFNSTLTRSQRNSLLCYFKNQVQPWFNNYIVNLQAESCNTANSSNTLLEYYNYQNNTDEIGAVQVIYLITQDATGSPSTPVAKFQNLFNLTSNNIMSAIGTAISTATGVTLLSGVYQGSVNINDVKAGTRTVTVNTPTFSSGSVNLLNAKLSGGNGAIYWGLSTSSASTPSVEQLFNCQDGSGANLLDCRRQVFANGQVNSNFNTDGLINSDECRWFFGI